LKADELRESFLSFFEERGHRRMPSAPLVPPGDPTLLFTSAGMVQFKPYFMGRTKAPHPRLTTVQKCFRTSDVDSVGDTSHLTFFEMLGNFSVGDYFKTDAIPWAWEYVTKDLALDPERLWAAVYLDDDVAYDLWRKVGVPEERIVRYGEEHNYWFSGDVGPCGPCSEIHYDFGEQFGCGPDCRPDHEDCDRFLEIWNLVFMSYYCDGEKRDPLPSKNIDTGAGLERIASALLYESDEWEDKSRLPSVYDTDIFQPIIRRIESLSGRRYGEDEHTDRAMRIVAEHARAVTFLVGDERTPVVPSNEERGYAVRRILRRAIYFGRRYLGLKEPFLADVAGTVIETMSAAHEELERQRKFVTDIVGPEEQRFEATLSRGMEMLVSTLDVPQTEKVLPGVPAFVLHDTYGFPLELTREIARERGFTVDEAGYEAEMQKQRERARAAVTSSDAVAADALYASLAEGDTAFRGYEALETEANILALLSVRPEPVEVRAEVEAPTNVEVILSETPFYPEGGGQVGDRGEIVGPHGRVELTDTQRAAERLTVHRGRVTEGRISTGDAVTARVDARHRQDTMRNHTATHLLHSALRSVLGTHVRQAGSLVAPDHLRFDFTHTEAMTEEQIAEVAGLVNEKIRQDLPVDTRTSTFDEAMKAGVLAFFGEKYGEEVRVVEVDSVVPKFSAELCGGTHCHRTGEIGAFVITTESSIGAGMRRVEALTGRGAEEFVRSQQSALTEIARSVGAPRDAVTAKVESLVAELDAQKRRIERLERSMASAPTTDQLLDDAVDVDGVRVLAARVDAPSTDALRYMADAARKSISSGVAVLATVIDDRPQFVALVTPDVVKRGPHAGKLLKRVASITGGGGGGRPEMAQGGGKDATKVAEALAAVPDMVREMLSTSGSGG
jgi:alanyl-tRNA synthetase